MGGRASLGDGGEGADEETRADEGDEAGRVAAVWAGGRRERGEEEEADEERNKSKEWGRGGREEDKEEGFRDL